MNKKAELGKKRMPRTFTLSEDVLKFTRELDAISNSLLVDKFYRKLMKAVDMRRKPINIRIKRLEFDIIYDNEED